MRTGIFGGTFDPPHLGHLILAAEACDQLELDRLLWVLTPDPPHKQELAVTSVNTRQKMIESVVNLDRRFEFSRVEIDRPGPHFAVDTVRLLNHAFPEDWLVYLIGGDSLHDLTSWHQPAELVVQIDMLGVMNRPGEQIQISSLVEQLPGIENKLHFIRAPLLEISSSDIRRRIAAGEMYRFYLPEVVFKFIEREGLYRTTGLG